MRVVGVPPPDVVFKGTLLKCNAAGRFWKARYFVLTPTALVYYGSRAKAEADLRAGGVGGGAAGGPARKGAVDLSAAHVLLGPGKTKAGAIPTPYVFRVSTGRRTYVFAAPDMDSLLSWVGVLVGVTHGDLDAVLGPAATMA